MTIINSLDRAFLATLLKEPLVAREADKNYLADEQHSEFTNSKWIIEIEKKTSIKDLFKIPLGEALITISNSSITFECMAKASNKLRDTIII